MADGLDAYFAGGARPPVNPGSPDNGLDDYFADQQRRQAALSVAQTGAGNPDLAGKANTLARSTGLPADTVERNLPDIETRVRASQASKALSDPKTAAWAADPRHAAVAADDWSSLSGIARTFAKYDSEWSRKAEGALAAGFFAGSSGLYGAAQAAAEVPASLMARLLGTSSTNPVVGFLNQSRLQMKAEADARRPVVDNIVGRGVLSGIESLPTTLTAGVMSAIGSPAAGLGMMGVQTGGGAYGDARDKGVAPERAAVFGAGQGAIEVATEALPFKFLTDAFGKAGAGKFITGLLGREMAGEQVATILQGLNEAVTLNPDKPLSEWVAGLPADMLETAIATITMAGSVGALNAGVVAANDRKRVAQAETDAQFLDDLSKGVTGSKIAKRDPSAFARFLALQANDNAVANLHIPAEKLATFYQDNRIEYGGEDDPYFGFQSDFKTQMDQALLTGGDVVIPTADFAAHLAGTPVWDAVKDDLRARPDGMSINEARSFETDMADAVEGRGADLAAEMKAEQESQAPAKRVFDDVLLQLRGAGYTLDAAETQAALLAERYATRGARLGVDAWAAYQRSGLKVERVLPESVAPYQAKDQLDILYNAMRKPAGKEEKPGLSLAQFVAKRGGVVDAGGDLASMGANDWHRGKPGQRKLIRAAADDSASFEGMAANDGGIGYNISDAAQAAFEEGYFPSLSERPDDAAFLDALGGEISGRPLFRLQDEDAAKQVNGAVADLMQLLDERGVDPATATLAEVRKAVGEFQAEREGEEGRKLDQSERGSITFADNAAIIRLFQGSDLSTFAHESGHLWLEELRADATGPDATPGLLADWEATKAALGIASDEAIPVEAHEAWARSVEQYLMEGKAPSIGLRRVFDGFRSWLLRIYQVVSNLNAPLNDELRGVMDRLLATDEAIAVARDAQAMKALFTDAATAGMTDAEFAAYRSTVDASRDEANDALLYRVMERVRRERTKAWKEERANVRSEIETGVNRRPEFVALHLLRTGRYLGGDPDLPATPVKLSRMAILADYGEAALGLLPKGVPPLVSDTGIAPDELADMVGAKSGDDLVRLLMGIQSAQEALREAGDKRSVRAKMTDDLADAAMTERHGDVLNDGSIQAEALAAIHSDRAAQVIATEARALARRAGQQPTPLKLAREWAARAIAEKVVRDGASPAALNRYAMAERKAARAAEKAILAGDADEAFRQKQAQMLNFALFAEAQQASEDVKAAVKLLGNYAKKRTIKSMDQDYLDQIHGLLEDVGMRSRSGKLERERQGFLEWQAAQAANGIQVETPPRLAIGANYETLTVEQLRGLTATVKQIAHLGRHKQKLLDAAEEREYEAVRDEALAALESLRQRTPSNNMERSLTERAGSFLRAIDGSLLKIEQLINWMDGGNPNGVFHRVVFNRLANAQTREKDMLADYMARLDGLLRTLPKEQIADWMRKVDVPELINRETGEPFVMTKDMVIAMALNTGNDGNMQRLLDGYGWSPQAVDAVLDRTMTAEDWAYVQGVWDVIETLWPEAAALERRLNGFAPDKVERREVTNRHGSFAGGYYPAIYDPLRSDTAAQQGDANALFENSYTRANTRAASTNERSKEVKRPLHLSLGVINRHVGEVIHDIAFREAIIDADRLLGDAKVKKAIGNAFGPEYAALFRPWLQGIANEWVTDKKTPAAMERVAKFARTSTTVMGLGYRLSTIVMQVLGYSNIAEVIGAKWLAVGFAQWAKNPAAAHREATALSGELRHRFGNMDRDVREQIKKYAAGDSVLGKARRFAFYGIGFADLMISTTAWTGGYNKALSQGMSEDEAVQFADGVVRQSQGSGNAKDLSAIMRGSETSRLFTIFFSYFNALYARQRNLGRDIAGAVRAREVKDLPHLLARSWWLLIVPTLGQSLLSAGIKGSGGPDDDEDWGLWALRKIIGGNLASIPFLRDAVSGLDNGFGYTMSPAARMVTTLMEAAKNVVKAVDPEREPSDKWLKNAIETTGYVMQLPVGQVATAVQFLDDVAQDRQDPEGVSEWFRGLTTGKAEPRNQ